MASWQSWKNRSVTALLLGVASSGVMAVPTLTAVATPNPVVVGTPVLLNLLISDIADLFAFQFSLSYNPAVLQLTSVTEGAFLATGGPTVFGGGTVNNTTGTVSFLFDSLIGAVPGVTGTGVLAKMQFTTVAPGVSALSFTDALFLDAGSADITVLTPSGSVQVTAVPEPASYALFALGIAGLAGLKAAAQRRATAAA
jgi:hypothetical protein